MATKYQYYKTKLNDLQNINIGDAHMEADNILCEIAISAADGEITKGEAKDLVGIFKSLEKWYE